MGYGLWVRGLGQGSSLGLVRHSVRARANVRIRDRIRVRFMVRVRVRVRETCIGRRTHTCLYLALMLTMKLLGVRLALGILLGLG